MRIQLLKPWHESFKGNNGGFLPYDAIVTCETDKEKEFYRGQDLDFVRVKGKQIEVPWMYLGEDGATTLTFVPVSSEDAERAVEDYESGKNIRPLTEIMEYIDSVIEAYREDHIKDFDHIVRSNFRAIRYLMIHLNVEARDKQKEENGNRHFMAFVAQTIEKQEEVKSRWLEHNMLDDERWDDRFQCLLAGLYRMERFVLGYPWGDNQ